MVKLDRIYTRGGDGGETSLVGGQRIRKSSATIHALASVDYANATIGLAKVACHDYPEILDVLDRVQHDLFDMGADLANPQTLASEKKDKAPRLKITEKHVDALETYLDQTTSTLPTLLSFILPGGNELAARLHLARCQIRLAEISVCRLRDEETQPPNPTILKYLNRLSDMLFVMARQACQSDQSEVLWLPGRSISSR